MFFCMTIGTQKNAFIQLRHNLRPSVCVVAADLKFFVCWICVVKLQSTFALVVATVTTATALVGYSTIF
jgi:hypothetical protein